MRGNEQKYTKEVGCFKTLPLISAAEHEKRRDYEIVPKTGSFLPRARRWLYQKTQQKLIPKISDSERGWYSSSCCVELIGTVTVGD